MIDIDSDGVIGAKEYRYNCITRIAVDNIQTVDDAFNKLLDVNILLILGLYFDVSLSQAARTQLFYLYCLNVFFFHFAMFLFFSLRF